MKNAYFTVEAGRCIYKDGASFLQITRSEGKDMPKPYVADAFTHKIVALLNDYSGDFEKIVSAWMKGE